MLSPTGGSTITTDHTSPLRGDFLMLITAAVWGTAFVAQRAGMEHVGPHTFNAVRFALGGLSLVPFLFARQSGPASAGTMPDSAATGGTSIGLPLILSGCSGSESNSVVLFNGRNFDGLVR